MGHSAAKAQIIFLHGVRAALSGLGVLQVTTEMQRQDFREALDAMEDWLYEDEANAATADALYGKMLELQKMGDPIKARVSELERRPDRVKAAVDFTDLISMAINSWPESKPWLNSTHVEDLKQRVYF